MLQRCHDPAFFGDDRLSCSDVCLGCGPLFVFFSAYWLHCHCVVTTAGPATATTTATATATAAAATAATITSG